MPQVIVTAPLGYSLKFGEPGGPYAGQLPELRAILGEFKEAQFHLLRFGPETFELTISYTSKPTRPSSDTVAGMLGDQMYLQNGAMVIFEEFFPDTHQLKFRIIKQD